MVEEVIAAIMLGCFVAFMFGYIIATCAEERKRAKRYEQLRKKLSQCEEFYRKEIKETNNCNYSNL